MINCRSHIVGYVSLEHIIDVTNYSSQTLLCKNMYCTRRNDSSTVHAIQIFCNCHTKLISTQEPFFFQKGVTRVTRRGGGVRRDFQNTYLRYSAWALENIYQIYIFQALLLRGRGVKMLQNRICNARYSNLKKIGSLTVTKESELRSAREKPWPCLSLIKQREHCSQNLFFH